MVPSEQVLLYLGTNRQKKLCIHGTLYICKNLRSWSKIFKKINSIHGSSSYTVGGNITWCSHYGKQYGGASKKIKIKLPYDPAIPLLGTYPEKTMIWKDTCTPMFIAAQFTIAKTWKQPKCPTTDEWIKMWDIFLSTYTHNGIQLSHKNEWNNVICRNTDEPRDYHTK